MTSRSNSFDSVECHSILNIQSINNTNNESFSNCINNNVDNIETFKWIFSFSNNNSNNIDNNNNNQEQNNSHYYNNNSDSNNNQENNINQNTEINISNSNNNSCNNNNGNNRNRNKKKPKHTKNSFDSLRRKLKLLVKKASLTYINSQIKNEEDKIKKTGYSQIQNTKKENEVKYMNSTLGELFSAKLTNKYKTITDKEKYNAKIITKLCSRDERLKRIFDITFIGCLNHFIGKETNADLDGMKTFEKITFNDEMNKKNLKLFAFNYEQKVNNIRERPKRMKKEK